MKTRLIPSTRCSSENIRAMSLQGGIFMALAGASTPRAGGGCSRVGDAVSICLSRSRGGYTHIHVHFCSSGWRGVCTRGDSPGLGSLRGSLRGQSTLLSPHSTRRTNPSLGVASRSSSQPHCSSSARRERIANDILIKK